jgi:UDP-GlcNAc:undecaprenyl-phosphate GlcNAc-1-phosphate transferase
VEGVLLPAQPFVPVVVGFGAAVVLTPLVRILSLRLGVIDLPIGMKIHERATPLMGGVAVYLAFALAAATILPMSGAVVGLLVGGLAAVVVGIADDVLKLPPLVHLAGQVAAALIAVVTGLGFVHNVSNPLGSLTTPGLVLPAALGVAVTLFWLVGMMNTMNFLDGLDGLVTGVGALAALLLAIWAGEPQRFYLPATHPEYELLPLALFGALLGFLPFNWHRARIFIGDPGTMFLGLALGGLSIVGPAKLGTALLVLLIPVLDVAWAIVRRQLQRRSFLSGDKQHFYHRMLELGLSHTTTVIVLYVLCAGLGLLDLYLVRLQKLVAFAVLAVVVVVAFVYLEVRATRRRAATKRSESSLPQRAR